MSNIEAKAKADAICNEIAQQLHGKDYYDLTPLQQGGVIARAVTRFDERLVDLADMVKEGEK